MVPVAAALGGMALPALLYVAVNAASSGATWPRLGHPDGHRHRVRPRGARDRGSSLPVALRAFLLTLAVVDDLGAIVVIAAFYTDHVAWAWLPAAVAAFGLYAWLQRERVRSAWIYVPLAIGAWMAVHESGLHATVAGVTLGLLTRVGPTRAKR